MSKRRDPEWRNRAAAELLNRHLSGMELSGSALVIEDPLPDVAEGLASSALEVEVWNRRALNGRRAAPWPTPGPFAVAALRLPRGKDETSMSLHAAASVVRPGGTILVYGAKDEGIQGALGTLGDLFHEAETVAIGGHCRVLRACRGEEVPGIRTPLTAWKSLSLPGHPELPPDWISYPGVFAHGRLDDGTSLLLDALPDLPPGSRVLDYGCGSGVVGYVAGRRGEGLEIEMLDVDSVALEAAIENVPGIRVHLRDGLPPVEVGSFDAILSNPPFHRGKAEDPEMIVSLVRGAPALLRPKGILVFVAQRRLPLEGSLRGSFRDVTILAEDPTFRVWMGRRPKRGTGPG